MAKLTRKEYIVQKYEVEITEELVNEINRELHRFPENEDIRVTENDIIDAWEENENVPVLNRDFAIIGNYRETVGEYIRDIIFDMLDTSLVSEECMDAENHTEWDEEDE